MISIAPEVLLALTLVAIYLFDSAHFLCIGEAVVTTRRGSLHGLSFGWTFEFAGRRPYVPNPFIPFRPDFRVEWDTSGGAVNTAQQVAKEMRCHLQAARALGWLATACGVLIVLIAPLALAFQVQLLFLTSVVLCLLLAIAASALLAVRKSDLGVTTKQACSLIFVALVCLPCAPNLARAAAIQRRWTLAASDFAGLGFQGTPGVTIQLQLRDALSSAKRFLSEDSKEFRVISEQLRNLEGENR